MVLTISAIKLSELFWKRSKISPASFRKGLDGCNWTYSTHSKSQSQSFDWRKFTASYGKSCIYGVRWSTFLQIVHRDFILSIPVIFTTLIIFMAHIKGKSGYHGMLIILKSAYLMLPTNSFNSKINKITNKFKE